MTTFGVALASAGGAFVGAGFALLTGTYRLPDVGARLRQPDAAWRALRRMLPPGVAGTAAAVVTGWPVAGVAAAALAVVLPRVTGGGRTERATMARLEALAVWTEALRDLIVPGATLPDALRRTQDAGPPALRPALDVLARKLAARESLDTALRSFADAIGDASGDLVVAALALNARSQGPHLSAVLTDLADALRAEVEMRRTVDAERRSTRRAVRVVVAITAAMTLGLAVFNQSYVAPYRTAAGQLALAVVFAIWAAALAWMTRLARIPTPGRFLVAPIRGESARSAP
jgi:Flp pilus assembly protein TadB